MRQVRRTSCPPPQKKDSRATCTPTASKYSKTPLIRKLVIQNANYQDRPGLSGKFMENSTTLTALDITGYRIKYSTLLRLLEFQISMVESFRRR